MDIKEKINLKRLTSILKKNTLTIIVIIIIFIIGGCIYSFNFVEPKYKSSSTILLVSKNSSEKNSKVTQNDVTLNKSLLTTYGNIITSNNVLEKVRQNLQIEDTIEQLSKNIKVDEVEDTQLIKVDVINENADEAQKIAEELNNVFIQEIKNIYNIENVTVVDKPSIEDSPYNINHIRDIILFGLIGILASVIYIFISYVLDTSIKIEQDIEDYTGLNVIGTMPKSNEKEELIVNANVKSTISEAFKTIRTNIEFTNGNKISKSILFTSCNSGEGKSWITSNIAVAYAQANKNVIIVDSDMRKGRQHQVFSVDNKLGLSNCLNELEENNYKILEKYIRETKIPKVHIITIGAVPPNPSELLLSSKMEQLIKMLKNIYDIVIIDGTPCNLVSDSIPVSSIVDETIIVTESKKTKIEDLKHIVKLIKNANGNIIGAILNKKELKRKEYGKGYYYGNIENIEEKINIEPKTVSELIENRREEIEEKHEEKNISENDTRLETLSKRIEDLEDLLLEIPDLTLNNYNKIVEEVKKVYENELDKNALAEKIKNDIVKNELIDELKKTTGNTEEIINKKLQELDNKESIENIINRINDIEQSIKNDETQENIVNKIDEMKNEQDEKLKGLDSSKVLNNLVIQMQKINNKYEDIENIEKLIKNNNSQEVIIRKIDEIKTEQNGKIEKLDKSEELNNITKQIQELNEKYKNIENLENIITNDKTEASIIEKINEMQTEQNGKIEKLDKSEELNNITKQIQELNEKYKNIENLENIITNDKTEASIIEKIKEMQTEQNGRIEKLDKSEELNNITKQIQELNEKYKNIENLENIITNDKTEASIIEKINEMQTEQNGKIEKLDKSEELNNITKQIQELNEKYKNIENLENIITNDKTEASIIEKIKEMQTEQNRKIEMLNSNKALNNLVIQMQRLNEKYKDLENIENLINKDETEIRLSERLNELQEEQDRRIRQLDNTRELNNLIIEMQNLNRKYEKVQSLEKAITNDKTEERINKMIEKMKKENDKKLEKIDNTVAIKEIMKELKKINTKYDKMAEKLSQTTRLSKTRKTKNNSKKNNVIEITELKDKLNKQELIIEFGKEIEYEQLLNTAVDTYEIKPDKKSKKA